MFAEPGGEANDRALLVVEDLRTVFNTNDGVIAAVDGVSFVVRRGETLGIVGESGCGKSMTALSLMRLVPKPGRITSGRVLLDGVDLLALPDKRMRSVRGNTVAMVFQDPMSSLNPVLTIGEQISEALRLHLKLGKTEARERTVELLELVGIPGAATRVRDYPHQFSGGMRQRVMIAMAMACDPKVMIADEITTALDVTIQAQVLDLLRQLVRETGTSMILITHDLGVVSRMAARVQVMYAGRIVETATTTTLLSTPAMPYTWGLLQSAPRLEEKRRDRLTPIPGQPPDLAAPPKGCRFEPRCKYRRPICSEREPDLLPIDDESGHRARCWGTQAVADGGWLRSHGGSVLTAEAADAELTTSSRLPVEE